MRCTFFYVRSDLLHSQDAWATISRCASLRTIEAHMFWCIALQCTPGRRTKQWDPCDLTLERWCPATDLCTIHKTKFKYHPTVLNARLNSHYFTDYWAKIQDLFGNFNVNIIHSFVRFWMTDFVETQIWRPNVAVNFQKYCSSIADFDDWS